MDVKEIRQDLHSLDKRVAILEINFIQMNKRFGVIESRT